MFREVGVRLRAASLEERDFDTRFRQALAGPAARSAGAHHENVKGWIAFRGHLSVGW